MKSHSTANTRSKEFPIFVTIDGIKLGYLIEGKGIPCVVIGSPIFWPRTFSRELRQHLKLIFMNTRLFLSPEIPVEIEKITMDTLVDDVEQLRKTLDLDKIAVTGHSALSFVAFEYARKYPGNASHVIMIGMTPYFNDRMKEASAEYWESHASEERKRILKRNQGELTDEVLSKVSPFEAWRMDYLSKGPMWWYDPTYDGSWLWEGLNGDMDMINRFYNVILNDYSIARGKQVTTPVFVAVGRHDYACPYYLWDEVKDTIPNLSYNLFDKSGHYPMMEEQALFDQKLLEWIKSN